MWRVQIYRVPDLVTSFATRVVIGQHCLAILFGISQRKQGSAKRRCVLDTIDAVGSIRLEMPNRHHLPIDLKKFGLEDRNEVFVATEEPHGLIKATVTR